MMTVVDGMVTVLAAFHVVDHVAVGLKSFGRPDGYAARQFRRCTGQWQVVGWSEPASLAAQVMGELECTLPEQQSAPQVGDVKGRIHE